MEQYEEVKIPDGTPIVVLSGPGPEYSTNQEWIDSATGHVMFTLNKIATIGLNQFMISSCLCPEQARDEWIASMEKRGITIRTALRENSKDGSRCEFFYVKREN